MNWNQQFIKLHNQSNLNCVVEFRSPILFLKPGNIFCSIFAFPVPLPQY